jgi:hypothetical protein
MQPPQGLPGHALLVFPDKSEHGFRGSRELPAYVLPVVAARLKTEHKWENWEPYVVPEIEPPRATTKMLSPKSKGTTTVQLADGTNRLYPAGGAVHTVDEADSIALEDAGWRKVLSGPALPPAEKLAPGTRYMDTLSDAVFSLDKDRRWIKM